MTGCGGSDPETTEQKKYIPHDAYRLVGGTVKESYLEISSAIDGEAAVSVSSGGHLTLSDATIWKIGGEESGSPVSGMAGMRDEQTRNAGNPEPPPEVLGIDPPPPPPMPGERSDSDDNGPMAQNPGPGATHAAVFAGSNGTISLSNVSIETTIGEGNGLYASGDGSSITLVNGTITTDGDTAHGVLVTHQGMVAVENVTIITRGEHSSALATVMGDGTVTAVGGTYTAFGKYSAGIYSAGDISVTGVVCKSISDNAAVVEGGSRITLKDSILWARDKGGVMMYQSNSGAASTGPSSFEMTGGSISADDGPIFYVTNTTGSILIEQVDLYGPAGILMEVLKGAWGSDADEAKPEKGGTATLIAMRQILPGNIVVDEFSTAIVTLKKGTILKGAINADNRGKDVHLVIDGSSTWHLTSDSYLDSLTFSDGISDNGITNIIGNGHTVFYDRDTSPSLEGKVYDLPEGGKLIPEQR